MIKKILDIATAVILNVIFHTWTTGILVKKGVFGYIVALIMTLIFAILFLVSIGAIKEEEEKSVTS